MMHDGREVVGIARAMEITGVSRRTIYNWMCAQKLTVLRTAGGGPRFYLDELIRLDQPRLGRPPRRL
jgi:predicted site-specific integrase-resolvase